MNVPTNIFKQAIGNGEVQYGCWLAFANAYAAEISASAEFDWLVIDGEHSPNDLQSTLQQLQAIQPYTPHPVVRPVEGSAAIIKQLLDIGAQTLLIPMIESAEQAQAMVNATRYPPDGVRGVGAAIARASRWNQWTDYHNDAQAQICLLLQIESKEGVENLDEILAVDGFDGVFIGPADLAASLGHIGESNHPDVQQQIEVTVKKTISAGKAAGILTTEVELARSYRQMGATFIAVGVDVLLFANAMRNLASLYKSKH